MNATEIQLERMQIESYLAQLNSEGSLRKVRAYLQNLVKQEEYQVKGCPGCCSIEEMDKILDKAEAAFGRGEFVANEDALKIIRSW